MVKPAFEPSRGNLAWSLDYHASPQRFAHASARATRSSEDNTSSFVEMTCKQIWILWCCRIKGWQEAKPGLGSLARGVTPTGRPPLVCALATPSTLMKNSLHLASPSPALGGPALGGHLSLPSTVSKVSTQPIIVDPRDLKHTFVGRAVFAVLHALDDVACRL